MTYKELKEKIYSLQLEDLAHGLKVKEFSFERGFEVGGLGITPQGDFTFTVDCINPDYTNDNYWVIYKGHLLGKNKNVTVKPEIIEQLHCCDAFAKYFDIIKELENKILSEVN